MIYAQVILAALSFGREYLKFIRSKESCKTKQKAKVQTFRQKLKDKNSEDIEKMFTDLDL